MIGSRLAAKVEMILQTTAQHSEEKDVNEVLLENWHYMVEMGCGQDSWRLYGKTFGHPELPDGEGVFTSTPTSLDKENRIIITFSGRTYKLGTCGGNEEEQFAYIEEDIKEKGSKVKS